MDTAEEDRALSPLPTKTRCGDNDRMHNWSDASIMSSVWIHGIPRIEIAQFPNQIILAEGQTLNDSEQQIITSNSFIDGEETKIRMVLLFCLYACNTIKVFLLLLWNNNQNGGPTPITVMVVIEFIGNNTDTDTDTDTNTNTNTN